MREADERACTVLTRSPLLIAFSLGIRHALDTPILENALMKISRHTAIEAKALVVMAFRNGPIENIHSGRESCPMCRGNPDLSRISDPEIKEMMKFAVDRMATLLMLKESDTEQYEKLVVSALDHVARWDEPELVSDYLRQRARGKRKDSLA